MKKFYHANLFCIFPPKTLSWCCQSGWSKFPMTSALSGRLFCVQWQSAALWWPPGFVLFVFCGIAILTKGEIFCNCFLVMQLQAPLSVHCTKKPMLTFSLLVSYDLRCSLLPAQPSISNTLFCSKEQLQNTCTFFYEASGRRARAQWPLVGK